MCFCLCFCLCDRMLSIRIEPNGMFVCVNFITIGYAINILVNTCISRAYIENSSRKIFSFRFQFPHSIHIWQGRALSLSLYLFHNNWNWMSHHQQTQHKMLSLCYCDMLANCRMPPHNIINTSTERQNNRTNILAIPAIHPEKFMLADIQANDMKNNIAHTNTLNDSNRLPPRLTKLIPLLSFVNIIFQTQIHVHCR